MKPGSTISTNPLGNYVAGEFVATGTTFDNVSPIDGSVTNVVHEAGPDEVARAVDAARRALDGPWGELDDVARATILRRVADGIEARFDEFLRAEQLDTGKPVGWASTVDVPRAADNFRAFAELPHHLPEEAFHTGGPQARQLLNYTNRRPRGVIAAIVPWNLPLLLLTWKVAPALACGNTVVAKPSELTPTTATLLAEVIDDAGIPPGVFNVVHGFGPDSAGEMLIDSAGIDGITFTGGTTTGQAVMRAASEHMVPVSLELGGKNAAVVFADANLDAVTDGLIRSVFANSGQVCLCTERLYVHEAVVDELTRRLVAAAEAMRIGDPFDAATTMGPLISVEHRAKVLSMFDAARADGATLLTGGGVPTVDGCENGAWLEPTIWTGLGESSTMQREEVFGPTCHISTFATDDDAVALANDSRYGLAASVWSNDVARAHRVAQRLDVGIAWVNTWFARDLRTPFGGNGASGVGREGGRHSLEFYTKVTNVCVAL